jgi:hypothetical protein
MERRRTRHLTPATVIIQPTSNQDAAREWEAEWEERRVTEVVAPPPIVQPAPPDARRIYEMILAAAQCQIAATPEARAIRDAGLEAPMLSLIQQIAANAANPIAVEIDDALTPV